MGGEEDDERRVAWRVATQIDPAAASAQALRSGSSDTVVPDSSTASPLRSRGLDRVGRYRILAELGRGAMGTVFEAHDPLLDRRVALKLVHSRGSPVEPAERARLLREAKALGRLSHRNVVAVYDVIEQWETVFIAMELVEGTSMRGWLKHDRTLEEILAVFFQAGEGLAAAHAKGIVHRDFKPANALVGSDGVVRVCDFGIALDAPQHADTPSVEAGLGTPQYMAPEQREGRLVDARADQFSFCVTLHEALYGVLPDVSPDRAVSLPASARVPWALGQVLVRGLAWDPGDRFPSMRLLLGALHRARSASSPEGEGASAEIAELETRLATAWTMAGAGEWEDAAEQVHGLEERAREIGAVAILARILHLRANAVAARVGDLTAAEGMVREALMHAARGEDRQLTAKLWLTLLRILGYGQARYQEVRHLELAAELAVEGVPDNLRLRARLRHVVGIAAWRASDLEYARRRLEEARGLYELVGDRGALAYVLHDLGLVLHGLGAYSQAQSAHEACLAIWTPELGSTHTSVAHALANLSNTLVARGRLDRAQALQERALALRGQVTEPDSFLRAVSLVNLGEVLLRRRRYREARTRLEEGRRLLVGKVGEQHEYSALADLFLASVDLGVRQTAGALRRARRAARVLAERPDATPSWRHLGLALLAHAAAEAGDAEAPAHLETARAALATTTSTEIEVVDALTHLALAEHRCTESLAAIGTLRRAIRAAEAAGGPDSVYVGRRLAFLAEWCQEAGQSLAAREAAGRALLILERQEDLGIHPEDDRARQVLAALDVQE